MNPRNYQRELEQIINNQEQTGTVPALLLHSCCAPCSSYVLEYLSQYYRITVFYYNPNIFPMEEYQAREEEQKRLLSRMNAKHPLLFCGSPYQPEQYLSAIEGFEGSPEGGERCFRCYELRLRETARRAREGDYDYFTTTLTISPLKSAVKLNEIGERVGNEYGVVFLPSDFKKKNGYQRSVELSRQYCLYRQNYCGCIYSKKETEDRLLAKNIVE